MMLFSDFSGGRNISTIMWLLNQYYGKVPKGIPNMLHLRSQKHLNAIRWYYFISVDVGLSMMVLMEMTMMTVIVMRK